MQTLGAALGRMAVVRPLDYTDPDVIADLIGLPATADLLDQVEGDRAYMATIEDGDSKRMRWARTKLETRERTLARARQRDVLQEARPDGCWCLGMGGHGLVQAADADATDEHPRRGARTYQGLRLLFVGDEPVLVFTRYCGCVDGQRVRDEHRRLAICARAERTRRIAERLWDSLPLEYRDCTLDSYPVTTDAQRAFVARLRTWVADPEQPWLLLMGRAGRGKSGMAAALAKEAMRGDKSALFVVVPDLLDRIRASFQDAEAASEQDLMASLSDADLLVLDDLGRQHTTDWVSERLFQVVNHRYNDRRRTVVTSNLPPEELAAQLGANGPYVVSRITAKAGRAWIVDVSALPSLRQTGGAR